MTPGRESLDPAHDEGNVYPDPSERTYNHRGDSVFVSFLLLMLGIVWYLDSLRARDPGVGKTDIFR